MGNTVYSISFLLIILSSLCSWKMISKYKHEMTPPVGMRLAMANAMMSSLIAGTVLGIIILKMFVPTIIGILVGMATGYLTGKSFGFLVIFDAMMSGIMGGAMGSMLGVMMMGDHQVEMVLFLDLLYAIMMVSIWKWLASKKTSLSLQEEHSCLQSELVP